MAPCKRSFVVDTLLSTSIGVADGVDGVADGVDDVVDGVDDVVDGVDDVADWVDDVTFAASHAAFSALVSFCPGSYCFPVSPLYNSWG